MTKHIGIVGCSAEGASLCYRTICTEASEQLGPHAHPEVTMHTPSLASYTTCLDRGDLAGVAALMNRSAEILAGAGADFLICPDNTIHQALDRVLPTSPLPWLHIAEIVAEHAVKRGFKRLALLGTQWLVDSEVYPKALESLGIACVRPTEEVKQRVNSIIMDELVPGTFKRSSTEEMCHIIDRMRADGCDAAILGCTELPLVLSDENSPLPTLDSTRLLARAAIERAIEG
ncbi:MAG: amino acid racemase [Pseudomonadota bacterium]